jgi:hypothetical protein
MASLSVTLPVPPLGGVPIGSILPYIGPLNLLPSGWRLCDGKVVDDPDSALRGQTLPNLVDQRFLMGTNADDMVCVSGGSNVLSPAGAHTRTDDTGSHDHGGNNRPSYCGVYFIVRIK